MFESDANFGNDPMLLKQYENILNDDLSGQTEQRHRARVLPAGLKPINLDGYGEKFKDTLDDYLITSITGHFGVLPTEIGFSAKGGMGASGHQQGESQAAQSIGVQPLVYWLSKMLTNISYTYLGMPRELEFKFMTSEKQDNEMLAKKSDLEIRGATKTINERRSELGLPLLDTPSADQPMLVAGNAVYMFSPDGIVNVATAATGNSEDEEGVGVTATEQEADDNGTIAPADAKPAPESPADSVAPDELDTQDGTISDGGTKAGVPSKVEVVEALSRLAILPNPAIKGGSGAQDEDAVEAPWTSESVPTIDPNIWSRAELTVLPIGDLVGTDEILFRDKVEEHIKVMGQATTKYRGYPLVVEVDGKYLIIDGHHRLMAMWLLGMESAPVWLGKPGNTKALQSEVKAFMKWASKGNASRRDFEFKFLDPIVGEALNRCAFDGDMESARSLAKAYLA